jgi:uncharacterized protein YcaQ
MLRLTKEEARRALLAYQFLLPPRSCGPDGIGKILSRLRAVQVDPLDIVGRNAYLVMQSRIRGFQNEMLDAHVYGERAAVEAWDKVRSIVPMEDWWGLDPVRTEFVARYHSRLDQPEELLDYVREEVRRRGRVSSLDLEQRGKVDGAWSETSAVRAALERLFDTGELAICERDKGRKIYAPIDEVVPGEITRRSHPNLNDYRTWHVRRRVRSLGIASPRSDTHWIGIAETKARDRATALSELSERREVVETRIDDLPQTFFLAPELTEIAAGEPLADGAREVSFLAPLDNALWDRGLIEALFGFAYTWEVYKPAAKREYGYYVMPVLAGDEFVARWEPRRSEDALSVRGWWWEKPVTAHRKDEELLASVGRALRAFARYLGRERLEIESGVTRADAAYLRRAFAMRDADEASG